MTAAPRRVPPRRRSGRVVLALDAARVERALAQRTRYRYVQPRVARQGAGWRVFSPNCSRSVDPAGGEIPIAWLEPMAVGAEGGAPARQRWRLHAHNHGLGQWVTIAEGLTLEDALARLCQDPLGLFWP